MSSRKTARLRRRQAARLRRYKRLRKAGRLPVHTLAERRRAALERQAQRQREAARRPWIRRASMAAFAAFSLTWLAQTAPAAATTAPPAAVHNLYRDYLARQSAALARQDDIPHNELPGITPDAFVPYFVTGAPSVPGYPFYSDGYGVLPVARQDEMPHNELPDGTWYPGGYSMMGTASLTPGRTGPHYSGGAIPLHDGPGIDALGRASLDGWERYGGWGPQPGRL